MVRRPRNTAFLALLALSAAITACSDSPADPATADAALLARRPNLGAPAPAGMVSVSASHGDALRLWPFTGDNVAGNATDPVNVVFSGADPRAIRTALMGLDGDRTAFGMPAAFPFNCRWSDTPSGGIQATWSQSDGWLGSAIQLQCGDYAPLRFHLRLFRSGRWTIGGAHFEALIPGTADHQVLSWELAEQLVTVDMLRSGLLDPAAPLGTSGVINPAPAFRTIPAIIFNALPGELQAIAAGSPGPSAGDVPIRTDGQATVFNVVSQPNVAPGTTRREFTLQFSQVIPKPFCGGPADYLYVSGPLTLREWARVTPNGDYTSGFNTSGRLDLVPIDPQTGQPSGAPFAAEVEEVHSSSLTGDVQTASSRLMQLMVPEGAPGHGRLAVQIELDSRGVARAETTLHCAP